MSNEAPALRACHSAAPTCAPAYARGELRGWLNFDSAFDRILYFLEKRRLQFDGRHPVLRIVAGVMHGNLTKPRSIERIFLNSCFIRVVFSMLYVIRFNNNTNNNRKKIIIITIICLVAKHSVSAWTSKKYQRQSDWIHHRCTKRSSLLCNFILILLTFFYLTQVFIWQHRQSCIRMSCLQQKTIVTVFVMLLRYSNTWLKISK